MPDPKPEPADPRTRFKEKLRGLAPDAKTGSKGPVSGGSVPSVGAGGLKNVGGASFKKAVLVREDEPSDRLEFTYNPSEWSEDESSEWDSDKVANRARPTYAYKQGGERKLSFQLLLDEVGFGEPYDRVEKALRWLRGVMSPREEQGPPVRRGKKPSAKKFKADVLLLVRGERDAFRCHIETMKVREDFFAPNSQKPIRAWVDLSLVQNLRDDDLAQATGV